MQYCNIALSTGRPPLSPGYAPQPSCSPSAAVLVTLRSHFAHLPQPPWYIKMAGEGYQTRPFAFSEKKMKKVGEKLA